MICGRRRLPNVKTAEEAIEAELVTMDDVDGDTITKTGIHNRQRQQSQTDDEKILDAHVTSKSSTTSTTSSSTTTVDVDDNNGTTASAAARDRVIASMNIQADSVKKTATYATKKKKKKDGEDTHEDFAVEAARRVASTTTTRSHHKNPKKKSKDIVQDEDYAVAAARKIAANKKPINSRSTRKDTTKVVSGKQKTGLKSNRRRNIEAETPNDGNIAEGTPMEIPQNFKAYESMSEYRNVHQSISHPQGWLERRLKRSGRKNRDGCDSTLPSTSTSTRPRPTASIQEKARKSRQQIKLKKKAKASTNKTATTPKNAEAPPSSSSVESSFTPISSSTTKNRSDEMPKNTSGRKRKLNVKVVEKEIDIDSALDPLDDTMRASYGAENAANRTKTLPSKQKVEMDVIKETNELMEEIANQGLDMSPEELLQDVLKFDEDKKREGAPGSGFVTGAFDKAKELIHERNKNRQGRVQQQRKREVGVKEVEKLTTPKPGIVNPDDDSTKPDPKSEMTPEEELKAMFAAGQRIADGMITQGLKEDIGKTLTEKKGTAEKEVEELIAAEKTVSSYARVLDDELAELEVSINSSPGEECDGPMANPIFDPMSGPEKYNPNVDLDAVNYPGAMPGTKDVRLPKDLREAVQQAEFAAGVLMNLETVETDDSTDSPKTKYFVGKQELSVEQVENLQKVVSEACEIGIIDDPLVLMNESSRLQMVLDELWDQPEERFREIASNYKDLLLSDYFVKIVRQRMKNMAERDLDALRNDDDSLKENHARERDILGQLVLYAQALLKEARALGAELEAQQLEVIRSICKVAMDPSHTTEEETAMALSDAVRDMRPLLDDMFVAYLKYAVAEEEAKLARAGHLDDSDHNQWLFVLKIVQQGVYAEIAKGINRYIEHIWYILRMETSSQRRLLLEALVDDMPTMDVRPFVQVVDNIVGSLGDSVKGEFDGVVPLGEMTNKLLQLHRDVKEVLPPERIADKSRDADEWAARQKKRMLEQRKIGEQRLSAAKETEHLEDEIESLGSSGEIERFD